MKLSTAINYSLSVYWKLVSWNTTPRIGGKSKGFIIHPPGKTLLSGVTEPAEVSPCHQCLHVSAEIYAHIQVFPLHPFLIYAMSSSTRLRILEYMNFQLFIWKHIFLENNRKTYCLIYFHHTRRKCIFIRFILLAKRKEKILISNCLLYSEISKQQKFNIISQYWFDLITQKYNIYLYIYTVVKKYETN